MRVLLFALIIYGCEASESWQEHTNVAGKIMQSTASLKSKDICIFVHREWNVQCLNGDLDLSFQYIAFLTDSTLGMHLIDNEIIVKSLSYKFFGDTIKYVFENKRRESLIEYCEQDTALFRDFLGCDSCLFISRYNLSNGIYE